jgi:hypothetical protein
MSTTEGCLVVRSVREGADTSGQFAVTRGYRASEEARWRYVPRPTTGLNPHAMNQSLYLLRWGGRPGRDFRRQNSFQPARCQRIIVSGRTTTRAPRQLKNREINASVIWVAGSIRRGLTPRSTYKASCRRSNWFSVLIDCGDRNASRNQRSVSTTNWLMIPETISIGR